MADYTYGTMKIVKCTDPDEAAEIRDVLVDQGIDVTVEQILAGGDPDGPYGIEEVRCGWVGENTDLADRTPTSAWVIWEDPKYEWLGDLAAWVPGLGLFQAECDSGGDVVIPAHRLRDAVKDATDLGELKAKVDGWLGTAHFDAIARIEKLEGEDPANLAAPA